MIHMWACFLQNNGAARYDRSIDVEKNKKFIWFDFEVKFISFIAEFVLSKFQISFQ